MINRRQFLLSATSGALAAVTPVAGQQKRGLLLGNDRPDQFGFRVMWYSPVPPIELATYRLRVAGLVEKPETFTLDDLRALPQVSQSSRLKCVQCWSARATWGGFRFGELTEIVKPKPGARAIRIDCADKWYEYLSIDEMMSPRVLMALDMAGQPLTPDHGAPLRLVDPSKYGYKSAKLIISIEFVTEGRGGMACDIGPYYTADGNIQAGYDHPFDLGNMARRKISGGEITEY